MSMCFYVENRQGQIYEILNKSLLLHHKWSIIFQRIIFPSNTTKFGHKISNSYNKSFAMVQVQWQDNHTKKNEAENDLEIIPGSIN